MEARIHLESPPPPCCAACYQPADPEKRYVDFGASTDGPVTNVIPHDALGVVGHVVDEIVVCDTCIAEAAKLIGLGDVKQLTADLEASRLANDALHEQLVAQRAGVSDALDSLKAQVTGAPPPPTVPNSNLPIAPIPPQKHSKRPARRSART